jgi:predicted nucleic acid-binding Zn ribbon protein
MFNPLVWAILVVCSVVAGKIYQSKGRSRNAGLLAGCLLGPLGILLAFLTPPLLSKCPSCELMVRPQGKTCPRCGHEIPEEELLKSQDRTPRERARRLGLVVLAAFAVLILFLVLNEWTVR